MKIKIDERGWLLLERAAGKMKEVRCPWAQVPIGYELPHCGDWCSLFREQIDTIYEVEGVTRKTVQISLCKNYHTCYIEDFTDERGGE